MCIKKLVWDAERRNIANKANYFKRQQKKDAPKFRKYIIQLIKEVEDGKKLL